MTNGNDRFLSIVALTSVSGVGRKTIRKIEKELQKCSISWHEFWVSSAHILNSLCISEKIAESIKIFRKEHTICTYYESLLLRNIWVVSDDHEAYPPLLAHTEDRPLILFGIGNKDLLRKKMIAVVGTRKITNYGTFVAESFAQEFVRLGIPVVSGCMYGVDAVTQRAVVVEGGETIGVLGYGIDMIPATAARLTNDVQASGGTILSEYAPETPATKGTFPERNRIIAGMAMGVIVIEAALKSGSHITARCALDEGRSVFAVPGPITNPYSQGTTWLLQQGAIPITSAGEAISLLAENYSVRSHTTSQLRNSQEVDQFLTPAGQDLSVMQRSLVKLIQSGISTQDQMKHALNWPISQVLRELSNLEVFGILERRGTEWYARRG